MRDWFAYERMRVLPWPKRCSYLDREAVPREELRGHYGNYDFDPCLLKLVAEQLC